MFNNSNGLTPCSDDVMFNNSDDLAPCSDDGMFNNSNDLTPCSDDVFFNKSNDLTREWYNNGINGSKKNFHFSKLCVFFRNYNFSNYNFF